MQIPTILGGRKSSIVMLAMALLACHNLLGIDDKTAEQIIYLALGGSGVIALEDTLTTFTAKKTPPPSV